MYIRTKDGIYKITDCQGEFLLKSDYGNVKWIQTDNETSVAIKNIINQSENLAELCDEFVFNSDVTSFIIDKKHIEHIKATILKIYKENVETDYVKAMHPKLYGCIWTDKGLIYVAKMDSEGKLVLI